MNLHRRLLELTRKSGFLFPIVVITGFLGSIMILAQSWELSRVIDHVFIKGEGLIDLLGILQSILFIVVGRVIFIFFNGWLSDQLGEQVKAELRRSLMTKIDRLGPVWLRRQKTGEVATTLLQGVDLLNSYFGQFLPQVILAVVLPVVILIAVFPMDLLTGFILLVTAPLIPLFMVLIGRMSEKVTRRQWFGLSRMGDFLLDSIKGLKTLLLLGRAQDRLFKIKKVSEDYRISTLNVLKITFLSAFALEMIATIATAVVAVEIGLRLLYGQLDFQHAFFILLLAPEFYLPMRNLSMRYHAAMNGVSAAVSIYKILDEPEIDKQDCVKKMDSPPDFTGNQLALTDVKFRYKDSHLDVIDGFTYIFQPGKHYALVGENGAGKSTLLQLIQQLSLPNSGKISLAGQDSCSWDPEKWRKSISVVGQKPTLFNASILDNVRLFNPDYSTSQVETALECAMLGDLLRSLPEGLNTSLLELGSRLSAGERQRIALARAFLKNGSLILLDEPTSHLDAHLNQTFISSLQELMKNRMTIFIAHHFSLMKMAETVVMLQQGKIVETGTFQQLINQKGPFYEMVQAGLG